MRFRIDFRYMYFKSFGFSVFFEASMVTAASCFAKLQEGRFEQFGSPALLSVDITKQPIENGTRSSVIEKLGEPSFIYKIGDFEVLNWYYGEYDKQLQTGKHYTLRYIVDKNGICTPSGSSYGILCHSPTPGINQISCAMPTPPPGATRVEIPTGKYEYARPSRGAFKIRYSVDKWTQGTAENKGSDTPLISLPHTIESIRCIINSESEDITGVDLAKITIDRVRRSIPDAQLNKKGTREINGLTVTYIDFASTRDDITFRDFFLIYTGPNGTIQVYVTIPEKQYDEYEGDIEELLNGLMLSKDNAEKTIISEPHPSRAKEGNQRALRGRHPPGR